MKDEMFTEIGKQVVNIFIQKGYVNKLVIRNQELKKKYGELRRSGMKPKLAREELLKQPYVFLDGEAQYLTERNLIKILYD